MGDLNAEISEPNLASFCTIHNLKRLKNKPTSYKNPDNRSCIDLRMLTGKKHPKMKLQRLRKIQIWTFGSLVHKINSF